jgi:cytosine/adenosine deaminase-related metal-dependent hydrolase
MTAFPPFPTGDYRLINASVPVCLLDIRHGGDAQSDALAPAAATIAGGKIRRLDVGAHASASAGDDVAAGLPAFDLDGGMIWPVCADLHTHLDKGQTWFRVPNTSGRWQDALALVAKDRETRWSAEDVAARMDFSLRCAFVHGTAARINEKKSVHTSVASTLASLTPEDPGTAHDENKAAQSESLQIPLPIWPAEVDARPRQWGSR